jgi:NodT family efflux transporter outer membrane factor (OMF) lipoprotein
VRQDEAQDEAMSPLQPHAHARLAAIVAVLLGSGCAVGPDFKRPSAPDVTGYGSQPVSDLSATPTPGGEAQHFNTGLDISQQWWSAFASPDVDGLVQQALNANPDLQAAQAGLRAALENVAAQRGSFFPAVSGSYGYSKEQNPVGTLAPTLNSGIPIFSLNTASLNVAYSVDVFGLYRRQVESLQASADAQRYQMQATYLTLVSNTVTAAIMQAAARSQIAATQELIRSERESLEVLQQQYRLGAISMAQISAQQSALAQQEALLPALEQQQSVQHDLLAQLTGKFPSQLPMKDLDLSMLTLPQELPLTLPAKLIDQRPDVREAEAQLHAATANVGVAIANMLPQISLSAGIGTTAVALSQLNAPGTRFWNYGASLSQTLFAGGALVHKKRAAVALLDQAGAQYRSTVLQAFRQVADTLAALQADSRALAAQARAEQAAADALSLVKQNLQLGSASYLDLLTAQAQYSQAVVALAQARAARLTDTVALFQALGGGWWMRAP